MAVAFTDIWHVLAKFHWGIWSLLSIVFAGHGLVEVRFWNYYHLFLCNFDILGLLEVGWLFKDILESFVILFTLNCVIFLISWYFLLPIKLLQEILSHFTFRFFTGLAVGSLLTNLLWGLWWKNSTLYVLGCYSFFFFLSDLDKVLVKLGLHLFVDIIY